MQVRITKSTLPTYWYSDKIGEHFTVEYTGDYFVVLGTRNVIDFDDCKLVHDNEQIKVETKDDKLFTAAVAAMRGCLANHTMVDTFSPSATEAVAKFAWGFAEALIKEGKERKHL